MLEPFTKKVKALWRHRRLVAAYKNVFSGTQGELVLEDLVAFTGLRDRQLFDPAYPESSAFIAGQVRMLQRIWSFQGMSDADIARMMQNRKEPDHG